MRGDLDDGFPEVRGVPFLISDDRPEPSSTGGWDVGSTPKIIQATTFQWIAPECIPRRHWLYGSHYIRKFVSTTIAPGGVGKSALGIVEALSIVTGRGLVGPLPSERTNVWIWNGEDPLEEMQRRIIAACTHYDVDQTEIEGRLFVDSGRDTPIVIATQAGSRLEVNKVAIEQIERTIRRKEIGLIIVDPFVSSHRVSENDNGAIDLVVKEWAGIAERTGCSIELVHHSRKTGGAAVTVEDGRGASALLGAARSARVLNSMSQEEAEKAEVENRRLYFRVENGKSNNAPAVDQADWYKFVSLRLENGVDGEPGDSVGVVTSWTWPDALDGVTVACLRAAQAHVSEGGPWRENHQAKNWVGIPIAEALKLDVENKAHKRKITCLLKIWMSSGMFVRVMNRDPERRTNKPFIEVGTWATD